MASFLDRERSIAGPGFNRWLVPPAALAIHLCIGQAYATSVYKNGLVKNFDSGQHADRHRVLDRDRHARPVRRRPRHLGRTGRPAQVDVHRRLLLGGRLPGRCAGHRHEAAVAALPGLRRHRRHRPRHRLHLAGVDADQVVPGPAGHGHRTGDHGLRRWRADRQPAVPAADVLVRPQLQPVGGVVGAERVGGGDAVRHPRHHLLPRDDVRRLQHQGATGRLAAGRLRPGDAEVQAAGHHQQRLGRQRDQDPAVLLPVAGPVLQRDRGHRHPRAGLADDPGLLPQRRRRLDRDGRRGRRLRRHPVAGQHGRPVHLVVDVRLHRPQADLHALPRRRHPGLPAAGDRRATTRPCCSCCWPC